MRGLNAPPPHQSRAGVPHVLGHLDNLLPALHRAGAGDDGEVPAADGYTAHVHHRILRVKLTVGLFIGLLHPHDPLHIVVHGQLIHIDVGSVPHQAQNRTAHAVGDAHLDAVLLLQLGHQGLDALLLRAGLHDNDHIKNTPFLIKKAHGPRIREP